MDGTHENNGVKASAQRISSMKVKADSSHSLKRTGFSQQKLI